MGQSTWEKQKNNPSKRKMAIFVAEGYDFNLIIEARNRTKPPPSRGKKISGFWRFMCIRREQLDQAGDDIVHDDLALKDKVAQEWDNLGRKKQQEFKVLAKDQFPKARKRILDVRQELDLEQIPEEDEGENS